MQTSVLVFALASIHVTGASISERTVTKQDDVFQRFWGTEFIWKFEDLPAKGTVPKFRVPYSGYIYLDRTGGTASALRKYDRAFNGGRYRATAYEQWDTTAFKKPVRKRGGLFGLGRRTVMETPNWHGHCNGWTSAAIRHAEPQSNVTMNGVVFTRADIKALLAEIYIYNHNEHLLGLDERMNAGAFHAVIANWIGRGAHPMGMEADPGEQKWNYPIYSYNSSSAERSDRVIEVKMNLAYAKDSNGEYQESPRIQRTKYFHYELNLDANGNIVGGSFYRDSSMIDLIWLPLLPKPPRTKGHERGNPHVNVDQVLAIWRLSVKEEDRKKWLVIDPPKEDRISDVAETEKLVPVQDFSVPESKPAVAAVDADSPESDGDEPTAVATPEPTVEATAEPTAEATPEPTVEATTEATTEPTPEATPEPAPEPTVD